MSRDFNDTDEFIRNAGIIHLNEMQKTAIGEIEKDNDIILSSPTGSGKTIAFLAMMLKVIPVPHSGAFAMIVTPTRELALQITDVFKKMRTGLKVATCYGGHKREIEENNLAETPTLIVGTPGRIGDHIRRKNIKGEDISFLILDEFDKSMEMGFNDEMKFIFESLPNLKRRILASATPTLHLPAYLSLENPTRLEFNQGFEQKLAISILSYENEAEKPEVLFQLLCTIGNRRSIIFVNEKETIPFIVRYLSEKGVSVIAYHGSMEQRERETSITKFRNGTNLFLIATDLAGRGLDISNVRYIIHYDLPENEQIFIHRNGRTARMEASGDAVVLMKRNDPVPTFFPEQMDDFHLVPGRSAPDKSEWGTLYFSAGKKDKINKIDIAGFLMHDAGLKREDTGLIEVKDFYSFAAVRRNKMNSLLGKGKIQKIKNKKIKIEAAR